MNENIFRILAALILFTGVSISSYYRRKADKDTGEKIPRKVDGSAMMTAIKIGGLILWISPLVYLINPQWMTWSKIGLPESVRWLGVKVNPMRSRDLLAVQQYRQRHHPNQRHTQGTQTSHQRTISLGATPALHSWGILVHCIRDDRRQLVHRRTGCAGIHWNGDPHAKGRSQSHRKIWR